LLKWAVTIVVEAALGWLFRKLKDDARARASDSRQQARIDALKKQLEDADTELERRKATEDLARRGL